MTEYRIIRDTSHGGIGYEVQIYKKRKWIQCSSEEPNGVNTHSSLLCAMYYIMLYHLKNKYGLKNKKNNLSKKSVMCAFLARDK